MQQRGEESGLTDDGLNTDVPSVPRDGALSASSCRKVQSIFEVLYHVHHKGQRRTPMHLMNGNSVQGLGRGDKILCKILNHEGLCSSYDEVKRYHHDLAMYTSNKTVGEVFIPDHLDKDLGLLITMSLEQLQTMIQ